jgi:drug/metabolite transporter (DMT)-like permease
MSIRHWLLLIALAMIWGASFFLMAIALRDLPPLTIVAARVALGASLLLVMARALPRNQEGWIAAAGMALLNNAVPFTLIVLAQGHISSGLAAVVNAATPVFAMLLAAGLTPDERLTPRRLAGALAGIAGVALLAGPAALAGGTEVLGILLCLGACLSYGFASVWSRRIRAAGLAPLPAAAGQCLVATLIMAPLALAVDQPWRLAPGAASLAALLVLGLLATGLAYALFFALIAGAGATNAVLVTLLVPVTALLLGTLALDEVLAPRHLAGMAVIGAGLLLIDGRLFTRAAARPRSRR